MSGQRDLEPLPASAQQDARPLDVANQPRQIARTRLGGPALFTANGRRLYGTTTDRTCVQCGCAFLALVSHVKQGMGLFCSRACLCRSNLKGKGHRWTSEEAKIVGPIGGHVVSDYWKQNPPVPYYRRHPQRARAHRMVHNHLKNGTLKSEPCVRCGTSEKLHAHHEDYGRPLDVTWLCATCHRLHHGATA